MTIVSLFIVHRSPFSVFRLAGRFRILLGLKKSDEFLVNQVRSFPLRDVSCLGDSDES